MNERMRGGHVEGIGASISNPIGRVTDSRTDGGKLTSEAVHGILGNRRRRYVLECLREENGSVGMRELCVAVPARENDIAHDDVRPKQRKRVYTALRQTHLPRLAAAGLMEYDRDRSVVTPTDRLAVLDPYLREPESAARPWADYYLGVGLAWLLFAVGTALYLPIVAAVPDGASAVLVAAAVVVATAHRYSDPNDRRAVVRYGTGAPGDGSDD